MADGKLSIGQIWHPPSAKIWNAMVDAGLEYLRRRRPDHRERLVVPVDSTRVTIKNTTGAGLAAGRALEIGDKILTTIDRRQLWFSGSTPTPDPKKLWGITELEIPNNGFGSLIVSGVAVARLLINDADHVFADVAASSTILSSAWHGMPILYKPAGTGTVDAVIRIGTAYNGPFDAVITQSGGIAGGSSGTADVKWNGSTVDSITVYNDWMDGGLTVGQNAEVRFNWQPDKLKYVLVGADCT